MLLRRVGLAPYQGSIAELHGQLGCVMRETDGSDRFIMRLWNGVILRNVRGQSIDWVMSESQHVDGERDCMCGVSHPPISSRR